MKGTGTPEPAATSCGAPNTGSRDSTRGKMKGLVWVKFLLILLDSSPGAALAPPARAGPTRVSSRGRDAAAAVTAARRAPRARDVEPADRAVVGAPASVPCTGGAAPVTVTRRGFVAATVAAATAAGAALGPAPARAEPPAGAAATVPANGTVSDIDWAGILEKSKAKALGGGRAGASAAVVQVLSLMWLRTTMNYQYRYGGSLREALATLWEQGGLSRLYQGLPFALIQGPATRFGDTAANTGILTLLEAVPATQALPLPVKTACGSVAAGLWRVLLMPVDASKTALQVEGGPGLARLWASALARGPAPLYRGAAAQAAATAAGHFPWFVTYNFLGDHIPATDGDLLLTLVRSASMGVAASCVSDCVSNSLRVVKTTKQTAQLTADEGNKDLSYAEVVASIVEQDGVAGLFLRGLGTRLLINAIQGAAFSVLWRYFQQVAS